MKKLLLTAWSAAALSLTASMASDVVATVNGMEVTKAEIKQVLQIIDKEGKMEWDKLDKAKKEEIVRMIAPSKLMAARAEKELTKEEKESALAGFWMQKKLMEAKVSEDDLKKAYDQIKASFEKQAGGDKAKAQQFPPFEMLKPQLEMKVKQDTLIEGLMKDVKVEVK